MAQPKHMRCKRCGSKHIGGGLGTGFRCAECGLWNTDEESKEKPYVEKVCKDCGLVLTWTDDGPRVSVGRGLCANCQEHRSILEEHNKNIKSGNELRLDACEEVQNLHAKALDEHNARLEKLEQQKQDIKIRDLGEIPRPDYLRILKEYGNSDSNSGRIVPGDTVWVPPTIETCLGDEFQGALATVSHVYRKGKNNHIQTLMDGFTIDPDLDWAEVPLSEILLIKKSRYLLPASKRIMPGDEVQHVGKQIYSTSTGICSRVRIHNHEDEILVDITYGDMEEPGIPIEDVKLIIVEP